MIKKSSKAVTVLSLPLNEEQKMNTKKKKLPIYAYLVIFLLISHVVGILSLIKATRQGDTDLVSKDYYSHSVHYQQEIDAFRRCREFKRQPNIELNTQELKIRFPEGSKITEGQLVFYHPSASNKDQVIDLKLKDKEDFKIKKIFHS